jgi:anti-sigma factor RsiW
MKPMECVRENETLTAVLAGQWPDECDEELRSHVVACSACVEVVAVAGAFRGDHDLRRSADVPPVAHVWWRAAARLRSDASVVAFRPIVWTHAGAAAAVAGVAAAYFSRLSIPPAGTDVTWIIGPPLLIAGAAMVLLTPLVILLALRNN